MSKNTDEVKKSKEVVEKEVKRDKTVAKKETKKSTKVVKKDTSKNKKTIAQKTTSKPKTKKNEKTNKTKKENKSIQNTLIENIKNFITKIIEMQEKVRQDEEEDKKIKKEETTQNETEQNEKSQKYLLEYYDLPYRYNETVVKILAQTPKRLFVYWDISDKDKQTYLKAFGEHFFEDTYPVLLVHNENKNYTSEVAINDFANSWYLDISNPRDKYVIQLGRKFKAHIKPQINPEIEETNINLSNDYLFIAMSNKLEVPNDHILFEEFKPYVKYRNVKTKEEYTIDVTTTIFHNQLKALYKELYNGEIIDEKFDMLNPSSMGTSSSIAK